MTTSISRPLTRKQAQDALGVGQTTIDKLIRTRQLKAFKVGQSVRIPREEIDRYIESQTR